MEQANLGLARLGCLGSKDVPSGRFVPVSTDVGVRLGEGNLLPYGASHERYSAFVSLIQDLHYGVASSDIAILLFEFLPCRILRLQSLVSLRRAWRQ